MLGGFVVLGRVCFFSVPLTGISIYLAGYVASITHRGPDSDPVNEGNRDVTTVTFEQSLAPSSRQ
jgi:hypothetical protein